MEPQHYAGKLGYMVRKQRRRGIRRKKKLQWCSFVLCAATKDGSDGDRSRYNIIIFFFVFFFFFFFFFFLGLPFIFFLSHEQIL
jgi:hypothetical protein